MKPGMSQQPAMNHRRLVGACVESTTRWMSSRRHRAINGHQELAKVPRAVALMKLADDFASLGIQRASLLLGGLSDGISRRDDRGRSSAMSSPTGVEVLGDRGIDRASASTLHFGFVRLAQNAARRLYPDLITGGAVVQMVLHK